jgi:phosphoserine aminotransferase
MSDRVFNFSAGPCCLPTEILEEAAREMTSYKGTGMSVMEMSHRSNNYDDIHNQTLKDLREILNVPTNYKILLMQGGAHLQFSCVPMNLLGNKSTANYLITGGWSEIAAQECQKYCTPNISGSSKDRKYSYIPSVDTWNINPQGAYFHYCANETIHGTEIHLDQAALDKIGDLPIVADVSSVILSRPNDYNFAVAYAGAQKNMGPAGVTVVIVREEILGRAMNMCPTLCNWKEISDANSILNTPPTFSIYMCGKYFSYVKRKGGVQTFYDLSVQKSSAIYDAIDESGGFYRGHAEKKYRSRINIPFFIRDNHHTLTENFLKEAADLKLVTLGGHNLLGGIRVSLYNGMPLEGALKLADFMRDFQSRYDI